MKASCCVSVDSLSVAMIEQDDSSANESADGEACGDCQAHLPVTDVAATKIEEAQPDPSSAVVLPPPAVLSMTAFPQFAWARSALQVRVQPPRSSPMIARLRTVVIRC